MTRMEMNKQNSFVVVVGVLGPDDVKSNINWGTQVSHRHLCCCCAGSVFFISILMLGLVVFLFLFVFHK